VTKAFNVLRSGAFKYLATSSRHQARRFRMGVLIPSFGVIAFDSWMPWIMLIMKWPLSEPGFFLGLSHCQILNDDILDRRGGITHDNAWRNDRMYDHYISKSDVLHPYAVGCRAVWFNGPCYTALESERRVRLVLLLRLSRCNMIRRSSYKLS
jgi:hypothetical protein